MNMSYSRTSAFRECKQKHYFAYMEGLKPKTVSRPLSFGGDLHKLLESLYNPDMEVEKTLSEIKQVYEDCTQSQQEALGENYVEDLTSVLNNYRKVKPKSNRTLVGTEIRFEIPIPITIDGEPQTFTGVIDKLEKDWDGKYVVTDYKTFSRAPDLDSLVMNVQGALYSKAVELLYGELPVKVVWEYIKSTPPEEPIYLEKSKRLSQAFGNKVTMESWLSACERYGVDSSLPEDKVEELCNNRSTYFRIHEMDVIPLMVTRIWKDFLKTVREIKYYSKSQTMNVSRNCSWCDYQPICLGILTGADVDYIKEKDYERGEK